MCTCHAVYIYMLYKYKNKRIIWSEITETFLPWQQMTLSLKARCKMRDCGSSNRVTVLKRMWRKSMRHSELSALAVVFIAASLDVSEQHQSGTEQSWDESRVRSVHSGRRSLTRLQPVYKPAGSCVHARLAGKSTLLSEARHSDHIKPLIVLAVALQGAPAVALKQTWNNSGVMFILSSS